MIDKLSHCCLSGTVHEGEPQGSEIKVAGLDTYLAGDANAETVLVLISDVFGWTLPNIRLLADEYASAGYRVLVPDFFQNDAVPVKFMKTLSPFKSDTQATDEEKGAAYGEVGPWLGRHTDEIALPLVNSVVDALSSDKSVKKLAVVGFCWGAVRGLQVSGDGTKLTALVAHHPSYAPFPDVFKALTIPVLVTVGDEDSMFPFDQVKVLQSEIFPEKDNAEVKIYPGAVHGFSCRGDQNNNEERAFKVAATKETLAFLGKHLS